MKSKKRIFLLISLVCIAAASLIAAGCAIGRQSYDDYREERNLTSIVTYYANGGSFSSSRTSIDLHYSQDCPIVPVDTEKFGGIELSRAGYVLEGWYYAVLDEGKPVFATGSETEVVIDENRPVDFENTKTQADEHLYIGAKWIPDVKIDLVLASAEPIKMEVSVPVLDDDGEQKVDEDGNPVFETQEQTFERGSVLKSVSFGRNTSAMLYDSVAPVSTDSQFLRFYTDENMENELVGAVQKPTDGVNARIYVEYIDKSWTVVKDTSDVTTMFASLGSRSNKFYIFDNIDCQSVTINMSTGRFNCTIEGNGYVLSNLNFNATSVRGGTVISMFGTIGADANMRNLKFENVNMTLTQTSGAPQVYAVFNSITSGATFENFEIENLSLSITYIPNTETGSRIDNIQLKNGVYQTDNWIYGGFENDSEFSLDGFELTGDLELFMNNEQVV